MEWAWLRMRKWEGPNPSECCTAQTNSEAKRKRETLGGGGEMMTTAKNTHNYKTEF